MNLGETINYKKIGFDGEKYIQIQKDKILQKIDNFSDGKLYLEIGGNFIIDPHASRTLPGFIVDSKKIIFQEFKNQAEILFCINSQNILDSKEKNEYTTYSNHIFKLLKQIEKSIGIKPHLVINKIDTQNMFDIILDFEREFQREGYKARERYKINGYPHNSDFILSENGFDNDDHIPLNKNLILVTSDQSNSSKTSTCLGQIYLDKEIGINSGYAKYDTFPVSDLPTNHPVNLAYEAASIDVGDFICTDKYYEKKYLVPKTSCNKNLSNFENTIEIIQKITDPNNSVDNYKSPTDISISNTGLAITNDEIVSIASFQEIKRRKIEYQHNIEYTQKLNNIEKKCLEYIQTKGYNEDLNLA